MRLFERRSVRAGVLVILAALALLSAAQGLRNALVQSQDLQWSGARMLMERIDPWADALQHDPRHMILKTQIPNYLPLLYLMMLPLGALPPLAAQIIWGLCNLSFAALSAWLAARFYGLGKSMTLAVLCLILMATPTRVTIGNGQYGLFVLVLWCASLLAIRITDGRAMTCGISYVKFNFAPLLLLYLLMKSGMRRVSVSVVPVLAGAILVCLWLGEWHSLRQILGFSVAPLLVAENRILSMPPGRQQPYGHGRASARWPARAASPDERDIYFGRASCLGLCSSQLSSAQRCCCPLAHGSPRPRELRPVSPSSLRCIVTLLFPISVMRLRDGGVHDRSW